jgi:hypothetical protein
MVWYGMKWDLSVRAPWMQFVRASERPAFATVLCLQTVDRRRRKCIFESDYIVYRVIVDMSPWLSSLLDCLTPILYATQRNWPDDKVFRSSA